jgi:signal peptidase I
MTTGHAIPSESVSASAAASSAEPAARAVRAWGRLCLTVLTRAYRSFLLTLVAAAVLPMLWSWPSYLVRTGSMEPSLAVGDVVVAAPFSSADPVPVGRVMVFENPALPGRDEVLVHRVVEYLGHGQYVTAGDANRDVDATPVPSASFRARARILVPYVGLPLIWLARGDFLLGGSILLLTVAAFVRASRRVPTDDEHIDDETNGVRVAGPWALGPQRPQIHHRARHAMRAIVLVSLVVGALVTVLGWWALPADAGFTATTRNSSNSWTVGQLVQAYSAEVLADGPYVFYLVDEASGSTAADYSGNDRTGDYSSIGSYRQTGALPNNSGFSINLGGGTGRLVSGGSALASPTTFSLELWFRTSTSTGGKLIGFESSRNATGSSFDRHVFMNNSGRIVYGGWSAQTVRTITSPLAYNNGAWHHLVLTAVPRGQQQDAIMYVDGAEVVRGSTSRTGGYNGWWRVGYGNLATGGIYPSTPGFSGYVDQPAVYTNALSAARVSAHYAAR